MKILGEAWTKFLQQIDAEFRKNARAFFAKYRE